MWGRRTPGPLQGSSWSSFPCRRSVGMGISPSTAPSVGSSWNGLAGRGSQPAAVHQHNSMETVTNDKTIGSTEIQFTAELSNVLNDMLRITLFSSRWGCKTFSIITVCKQSPFVYSVSQEEGPPQDSELL